MTVHFILSMKLNKVPRELREIRKENDFNEDNLQHCRDELNKLTQELNELADICIQEVQTGFIFKDLCRYKVFNCACGQ